MAQFRFKGRGELEASGYTFRHNEITQIPDDDMATLQKLRGRKGGRSHPSFEEVL